MGAQEATARGANARALSRELYSSLRFRIDNLEDELRHLLADAGGSRPGLRSAIEVTAKYPSWVRRNAESDWARASDLGHDVIIGILHQLLEQVKETTQFVDDWFRPGHNLRLPLQLHRAVERTCDALKLPDRSAILAVGSPANFETYVGDLVQELFPPGPGYPMPEDFDRLSQRKFILMRVPLLEGGEAYWIPVVCGHEVAHLALAENPEPIQNLVGKLDMAFLQDFDLPRLPDFEEEPGGPIALSIAFSWVEEILCDFNAARSFGPAGIASLLEFLAQIGALSKATETHPPGWLRAKLLIHSVRIPRASSLRRVLEPWIELAGDEFRPSDLPPWADALVDALLNLADHFDTAAAHWQLYDWSGRRTRSISRALKDLSFDIPPGDMAAQDDQSTFRSADVVNAAWAARAKLPLNGEGDEAARRISRLAVKSLDAIEFMRAWREADGPASVSRQAELPPSPAPETGILSGAEIHRRLALGPPDGIVITPLIDADVEAGGVDLRLGNKFITFRNSDITSFDPSPKNSDDPRAMQVRLERAWGETFVIHPRELVLAATLEYLWLPGDVSAQVITRSSWGRLGLITATAVAVNPGFRGCLTLELINLGNVPIRVVTGARMAQLIFFQAHPGMRPLKSRYDCPTEPEFSRIRDDRDLVTLSKMRVEPTQVDA